MIAKIVIAGLMSLASGCVRSDSSQAAQQSHGRVDSTLGFSFLPPRGEGWTEAFGKNQIMYSKKTDPAVASFFAGALDIKLQDPLPDKETLAAFVRAKKDDWGTDNRFTDVQSSFLVEAQHPSCVRYQMTANDHAANNRGTHAFLSMRTVGRFCTHPQNPGNAVDIFYSARHIPGHDAKDFTAEGEAFLRSLAFNAPTGGQNVESR